MLQSMTFLLKCDVIMSVLFQCVLLCFYASRFPQYLPIESCHLHVVICAEPLNRKCESVVNLKCFKDKQKQRHRQNRCEYC